MAHLRPYLDMSTPLEHLSLVRVSSGILLQFGPLLKMVRIIPRKQSKNRVMIWTSHASRAGRESNGIEMNWKKSYASYKISNKAQQGAS